MNAENILTLELLVRQIQYLRHWWEMCAIRADSHITPIRTLPSVFLYNNQLVIKRESGSSLRNINTPRGVLGNRM